MRDHEKTVRTAIKQDLSPDQNSLDYVIMDDLENKTNATSPNIGLLKITIEKESNKMSEEFNLKAWKSFQRRVDTMIKKKKKKKAILSKFTALFLPSFFVCFSN